MARLEVFPNPTVKQVIFQIKFPNLFYLENKIGDFQLKIMKWFPEASMLLRKPMIITDIGNNAKVDLDVNSEENIAIKIWQFKSPDRKCRLNLTSNALDISSEFHKTYNNPHHPNRFRDTIQFIFEAFLQTVNVPILTRVGFRYIDECPMPEKKNEPFLAYYNTTFPLHRYNLDQAEEMDFKTVIRRGDYYIRYIESLQLDGDGRYKLILDFDGYSNNVNTPDCLAVTDKLHDLIVEEYKLTLKEPVFEYMRTPLGGSNGDGEST